LTIPAVTESEYRKQPEMAGHLKVLEVLRRWDPIGVICQDNQDEYDSYAVEFIHRLDHRVSVPEMVEFMRGLVLDHMGLPSFDEADARVCATELAEFWRSWKEGQQASSGGESSTRS
jgi:hypothetical protein